MRLGIRRVNRRRSGRQAMMGSAGGVGKRRHTHTEPLGLPLVSNVMHVQPVSSSVNTALQYVSACSLFRRLAAARNWRPESKRKSCPDGHGNISSLVCRGKASRRTKLWITQYGLKVQLLQSILVDWRIADRDVGRARIDGNNDA